MNERLAFLLACLVPIANASRASAQPAIALDGWVQLDLVPWSADSRDELDPSTGAPLNQQRLSVRRARLRASAQRGELGASLEIDGNTVDGVALRLLAAELRWRARRGELRTELSAGWFKVPFGAELPLSDRERTWLEPSRAARSFFPGGYDAGVRLDGSWRLARWSAAVVNGSPVGEARFRGRDPSAAFDLVGRLGLELKGCGWNLRAGLSALTGKGFHAGSPPTKDQLVWVDANENGLVEPTELQVIDGDPATPSSTFAHRGVGIDVAVRYWARSIGWGQVSAELSRGHNLDRGTIVADPVSLSRDLRELGWYIGVEQEFGTHLLLAARYDRYHPDRDAFEVLGERLLSTDPTWSTVMVVASIKRSFGRLSAAYEHQRNPLGRSDNGRPATLAEDRVTVRAQVAL